MLYIAYNTFLTEGMQFIMQQCMMGLLQLVTFQLLYLFAVTPEGSLWLDCELE